MVGLVTVFYGNSGRGTWRLFGCCLCVNNGAEFGTCQHKSADIGMLGERLKEERERLGLTQTAFAAAAGAAKRTLIEWEKGATSPNAVQLSALAAGGADVLYILTGQRAATLAPLPPPPPTREALARGTGLDPAWPMVLELVYDQLVAHNRRLPNGKALRELVDAVIVVLRLEEGEPSNEKIRSKIEAIL